MSKYTGIHSIDKIFIYCIILANGSEVSVVGTSPGFVSQVTNLGCSLPIGSGKCVLCNVSWCGYTLLLLLNLKMLLRPAKRDSTDFD